MPPPLLVLHHLHMDDVEVGPEPFNRQLPRVLHVAVELDELGGAVRDGLALVQVPLAP